MSTIVIYWFRQDLRLGDNPALTAAAKAGKVLPIYILDDINSGEYQMGSASRWWLHHSLKSLNKSLRNKLAVYAGDSRQILLEVIKRHNVTAVYWNRCYEPWSIQRDKEIKEMLELENIAAHSFNGSLLWEPWQVLKKDGTPYRVFTPFYRKGCLNATTPRKPLSEPKDLQLISDKEGLNIADLNLLPTTPWDKEMKKLYTVGEGGADLRLQDFLGEGILHYKKGRDFPAQPFVSRLSPHLHFGEISPNQVWYAASQMGDDENVDCFRSELGWREFSYSLLYFNPELPQKNLQSKFDQFPWRSDRKALRCWQQGQTGYPTVDAAMRQLWQTGLMHNRMRMVVASFLVKNLLLHWQEGEAWFWDCLLDADLASNSASWQWVAGCGADAAPYFRVFNPVTQGKKFDPDGEYVREFVPELAQLPNKYLFCPWDAPDNVLAEAGVVLGETYPKPIVDLKASRERALAAYNKIN